MNRIWAAAFIAQSEGFISDLKYLKLKSLIKDK